MARPPLLRTVAREAAIACGCSAVVVALCETVVGLLAIGFAAGFVHWAFGRGPHGVRAAWIARFGAGWLLAFSGLVALDALVAAPGGDDPSPWRALFVGAAGAVPFAAIGRRPYRLGDSVRVALAIGAFWAVLVAALDRLAPRLPEAFASGFAGGAPAGYREGHAAALALAGAVLAAARPRTDLAGPARGGWPLVAVAALVAAVGWDLALPAPAPAPFTVGPLRAALADAPHAPDAGVEGFSVERYALRNDGGEPYVGLLFRPSAPTPHALVVFIQGSGPRAVRGFVERRLLPRARRRGAAVAFAERPGGAAFASFDSLGDRAREVNRLADAALRDFGPFRAIHVVGHSEGADVVTAIVESRRDVASAVLLAGGGLDPADEARAGLRRLLDAPGRLVDAVVTRLADRLVWRVTARVRAAPSADRTLLGLTHRRWASYLEVPPATRLLRGRCRVLSVHGTRDLQSPPETALHVRDRFARAGRSDHTLDLRPGLDHSFRDAAGVDYFDEVLDATFAWMLGPAER